MRWRSKVGQGLFWCAGFGLGAWFVGFAYEKIALAAPCTGIYQCMPLPCGGNPTHGWFDTGCGSAAPCGEPGTQIPGAQCDSQIFPWECAFQGDLGSLFDPRGATCPCLGVCHYHAVTNDLGQLDWVMTDATCSGGEGCGCCKPSGAPNGVGQVTTVPCYDGDQGPCPGGYQPPVVGCTCSGPPQYKCNPDPNSSTSCSDCASSCKGDVGYECQGGQCVQVVGSKKSLADCQAACTANYGCQNGNCVAGAGNQTQAECQKSCGGHYECVLGVCTWMSGPGQTQDQCKQNCGGWSCDRQTGQCVADKYSTTKLADCQKSCSVGYSCQRSSSSDPTCVVDASSSTTEDECKQGCQCDGKCTWIWGFPAGEGGCKGEVLWKVINGAWVQIHNDCKRGCAALPPTVTSPNDPPGTNIPPEGWEAVTLCNQGFPLGTGGRLGWQLSDQTCTGKAIDPGKTCGCVPPADPGAEIGSQTQTDCQPANTVVCKGAKTFHPMETDNDPNADQDGDGDNNWQTIIVINGDRDGDGCCDFDETWQGIDDPNIGCCFCDLWQTFFDAGGYFLTDRLHLHLHSGRLLSPGDRGASSSSGSGSAADGSNIGAGVTMVTHLYFEVDLMTTLDPTHTWPKIKIWIPFTVEDFVTMWDTQDGGSASRFNSLVTQWNAFRVYMRTGMTFLLSVMLGGLCLKEVRV